MMTSSRLVRGTKGRLFACLGVLTLFAGVIFLYHNARVELDEIRNSFGKCHQDQDSLAAQVQVISEYKKDLEKSLNLEKAEHRQTKEELQSRMNDEQQLRNKENLENVNKYKALQQQYKLLQSEHEDLSEICNKARAQQASCAEALTHLDSQLSTLQHDVASRDAEVNNFKTKFVKLEEENKILLHKLDALQIHLEQLQGGKEKGASSRRSSTKHANIESALGAEDGVGMHEQPLNVLPIAQRSSTVAQEEILQPVRPAQPGLLQSPLSKTLGKQTTTPKINADAVQSQDRALRVIPDLPLPLLLSPMQQHDPVEKQDFANNGPQGVLPAPFSFGNDNHYSQNAVPLQAPYKLHGLGHQDIPQNQGQMPPLAPAPRAAFQNNILPLPLDHAHNYAQHLPHFNQFVHQNLNPFRNDRSIVNHDAMGHQETQVNHPEQSLHKFAHNDDVFHLNGLRTNDALGGLYDSHRQIEIVSGNKAHVAEDNNKPMYQLERAGNAVPFHKNPLKNVNIVPLDGDVNQHSNLEPPGGNTFLDLHNHNVDAAHGKIRGQLAGPHDSHQGGHYNNYQGGDYDKEDPPANNEAEDEDLDQIDYNNEPNQAHPVHQVLPGHQAQKMIHRRLADRHQDGAVVRPR